MTKEIIKTQAKEYNLAALSHKSCTSDDAAKNVFALT